MTIRNKLSFQFTTIVALLLILFCVFIYYLSAMQMRNNFYDQLYDRAITTAYFYLEEDDLSPVIYDTFRQRYSRAFTGEIAQIFDINNKAAFIKKVDNLPYDIDIINFIRSNYSYPDFYSFKKENIQSVGMFYPDNQGNFVIIISAENYQGYANLENLFTTLVTGFFLLCVITFLTGRFFASQSLKPIPKIVTEVRNISASNMHTRLEQNGENDELSELISTFNNLLDRLEYNFRLQERFVANASHELRTPLTSIIGEIEVTLSKKRTVKEYRETLTNNYYDALTLHELTTKLLEITRAESEVLYKIFQPLRIDEILLEAAVKIEKKYDYVKININYNVLNNSENDFVIPTNRLLLLNVFVNLLDNAAKFSAEDSVINIVLSSSPDCISVKIQDSGIGIPATDIEKVFEPFYRSKEVIGYKGFGIGLSLSKRILTILNGDIAIESQYGMGSTLTVAFKKE